MHDGAEVPANAVQYDPGPEDATYGGIDALGKMASAPVRMMTTRQRLLREKAALEQRIKYIDGALALMDENPGVENTLQALANLGALRY